MSFSFISVFTLNLLKTGPIAIISVCTIGIVLISLEFEMTIPDLSSLEFIAGK